MAAREATVDSGRSRARRPSRYFFVGMALLAVAIVAFAFVPEYRKYATGTFPIAGVLHVHAAIMASWVAAFVVQAYLGATGRIALHRRVGAYAVALGWIAWASMIFVELRTYVVYPLPHDPRALDWDLPGPHVYLTFAVFLIWAVYERRRPAWHKRLMTFAVFVSLAAAIERYVWIPTDYGFGPFAALLDVCLLVPIVAYDLATLKSRLHPATIGGALFLFGSQAVLFALWGTSLWRTFALGVVRAVHR